MLSSLPVPHGLTLIQRSRVKLEWQSIQSQQLKGQMGAGCLIVWPGFSLLSSRSGSDQIYSWVCINYHPFPMDFTLCIISFNKNLVYRLEHFNTTGNMKQKQKKSLCSKFIYLYFNLITSLNAIPYILLLIIQHCMSTAFISGCVTLISSTAGCIISFLLLFPVFFSILDYISGSVCFNKLFSDGLRG